MKIGRITYTNTEPFFHFWDQKAFPLYDGTPFELVEAAKRGDIVAGPLPVTAAWELENSFEPLGPWGIAAQSRVNSVFLLSREPMERLAGRKIGLTLESSVSVLLLRVLLAKKYQLTVACQRGLSDEADAWLVIGDQALRYWKSTESRWPYVIDLAHEWWTWQRTPFVFARWIVRKDLSPTLKGTIANQLKHSLNLARQSLDEVAEKRGKEVGLPSRHIRDYLNEIVFELGPEEELSLQQFRALSAPMRFEPLVPVAVL